MIEKLKQHNGHGLVLNIVGDEVGAEKIANSLFDNGFCKEKAKEIIKYESFWLFLWNEGISVDMPEILNRSNQQVIFLNGGPFQRNWEALTLKDFLNWYESKK